MSKKKKKENKIKSMHNEELNLMDDIYNGTVDYSTSIDEEDDNISGLDLLDIEESNNEDYSDEEETTEFGRFVTSSILDDIDDVEEDELSEEMVFDVDNVNQFSEVSTSDEEETITSTKVINDVKPKCNMFYSFGVCNDINDNIYYFTDDIKSLYIDLESLDDDGDFVDNDIILIDDLLDEILPNFYPSGIYSYNSLKKDLKGLSAIDSSKFKFFKTSNNLVYGYYISETAQEELESLFTDLGFSYSVKSFVDYIRTASSSVGFSFKNVSKDYAESLLTRNDFVDSSMKLIELVIEDDGTSINKESDENILDTILEVLSDDDESDEKESPVTNNSELQFNVTEEKEEDIEDSIEIEDSTEEEDDNDDETLLEDIEDVEDPVELNEEHDSEGIDEELVEVEEINEDSTEEIFDVDDMSDEYSQMLHSNRNLNKNYNKQRSNNSSDDRMVVPRYKKNN